MVVCRNKHKKVYTPTLTEISKNPLPEELRHFKNELLHERGGVGGYKASPLKKTRM